MMREKIKITRIDYLPARHVTFSKRRKGDFEESWRVVNEIASQMKAVQNEMPTTVRLSKYLRKDAEPENAT